MSEAIPEKKDKLEPYNLGVQTIVAGAIVLVIGLLFQLMGDDLRSRLATLSEASTWAAAISWVFYVAPVCYGAGTLVVFLGSYMLYRAYRKIHPRDKAQRRMTEYQDLEDKIC